MVQNHHELSNKLMQFIENKREEIKTDVIAQLNDADGYNYAHCIHQETYQGSQFDGDYFFHHNNFLSHYPQKLRIQTN
jgi:hypothetical protein